MRVVVVALALAVGACGHASSSSSSSPAATPDYPSLPPLSNTPVGLMIDQASTIGLSTAQIASLQKIDGDLHAKNDVIEGDLDDLDRPAHAAADSAGPGEAQGATSSGQMHNGQQHYSSTSGGGGHGGGGRHRGGRGGGSGSGGSGEHVPLPTNDDPRGGNHSEQAAQMRAQEKANTQSALQQALQVLDADQLAKARAILNEHGYGPPAPPAELPATGAELPSTGSDSLPPGEP